MPSALVLSVVYLLAFVVMLVLVAAYGLSLLAHGGPQLRDEEDLAACLDAAAHELHEDAELQEESLRHCRLRARCRGSAQARRTARCL